MSGWTAPICYDCFERKYPDRQPVQLREQYREVEPCYKCGRDTKSGIYVRRDPNEPVVPPRRRDR